MEQVLAMGMEEGITEAVGQIDAILAEASVSRSVTCGPAHQHHHDDVDGVTDVGDWFVAEGDHEGPETVCFAATRHPAARTEDVRGPRGVLAAAVGTVGRPAESDAEVRRHHAVQLGELTWNATPLEGDAIDGGPRLLAEHEGDLVMSGCGEFARELIQAGVVDEIQLWIHPRIQGPGTRPFEEATIPSACSRRRRTTPASYSSGTNR